MYERDLIRQALAKMDGGSVVDAASAWESVISYLRTE